MVRAFAVLVLLALHSVAAAQTGPGTALVKQTNDAVAKLIQSGAPASQLQTAVSALLDIDELGKESLVDHWAKLKPAEQAEFLKLLNELIKANYIKTQTSNVTYTVTYLSEATNPAGHVVVKTKVNSQRKGRPFTVAVDYVLRKGPSGALKAFDIVTDGVGLVENYRAQWNKIIKDKGFSGVTDGMKKKLAATTAATPPAKP
jgi:phospholipid transport system substrate-binding protein